MAEGFQRSSPGSHPFAAAWAVLAFACSGKGGSVPSVSGSQTGDEGTSQYARTAGNGSRVCDFEETVFDASALTVFGVGMAELMAPFEPVAPVALHWSDVDYGGGTFTHVPGPGSTTLELEVSHAGEAPIYEIRNKPFEGQEGLVGRCSEVFYEVPVTLRMSTADGAFDEVVRTRSLELFPSSVDEDGPQRPSELSPVVITVLSPHSAYLEHRFDLESLSGNFELRSDDTTWDGEVLDANVWLYRGASTGRLELSLRDWQVRPGSEPACGSTDACDGAPIPSAYSVPPVAPFAPEHTVYAATWPSPLSCNNGMPPLPPETNLIGSSAADLTRLIAGMGALARSDDPLSVLSLGFAPLPAELCQGHTGTGVLFNADARVTESGLGLNLDLPLQVLARLDSEGRLGNLIASRADWELPLTAAQLAAIGIELPATSEFQDLYVQLTVRYTRQGDRWTGSAELRVHGNNPDPECLRGEAASRAEATEPRPLSTYACGRSDSVMGDNGAIPIGTPLLHHSWSTSE